MSTKESASSKQNTSGDTAVNSKKRTAGFWSVLLMVIGVQCGGLSTVWNLGATEGLKKLLLGHAIGGLMYVLLAVCFAELTSIVPFAGGSFGFCRAALGPFWGFMVGASEVLENIMKVVVCVYLLAMACTTIFETEDRFTPFWMLMWYTLLFGIHLRGGSLFWNTIVILGLISIGTVLMFCIGNTKDIDVELYGQIDNSTFTGEGSSFLESLVFPIWVYIGLEIVPQTCERVKDVHKNLPRGLVLGTLITYGFIFWVVIAVSCNAPGFLYPPAWVSNPFPFTIGFVKMFDTPDFLFYGPLFAIIPLFVSALTFMWGCGYQVASLARSGLIPKVFATTYGENETPVVALGVSTLVQFLMCVGTHQVGDPTGVRTCYTAMMIGASFVYVGMFVSFVVFRVNFAGMKRHWVSPVGIPGALVGIGIASILCIADIVLQANAKSLTTYFVFMGCSAIYYVVYGRHTQYFSKEEQKHFLKAYILNANHSKQKAGHQKAMGSMFAPMLALFALPLSAFSKSNGASSSSIMSAISKHSGASSVPLSKHNSVAPAPQASAIELPPSSKADAEVRAAQEPSHGTIVTSMSSSGAGTGNTNARPHGGPLRTSWAAAAGSTKVGWSGKAMTMTESKKFLELLMSAPEDVASQLVESLPNQFVAKGIHEAAISTMEAGAGTSGEAAVEREVLLQEIMEGPIDDDEDM